MNKHTIEVRRDTRVGILVDKTIVIANASRFSRWIDIHMKPSGTISREAALELMMTLDLFLSETEDEEGDT